MCRYICDAVVVLVVTSTVPVNYPTTEPAETGNMAALEDLVIAASFGRLHCMHISQVFTLTRLEYFGFENMLLF